MEEAVTTLPRSLIKGAYWKEVGFGPFSSMRFCAVGWMHCILEDNGECTEDCGDYNSCVAMHYDLDLDTVDRIMATNDESSRRKRYRKVRTVLCEILHHARNVEAYDIQAEVDQLVEQALTANQVSHLSLV